LAIAQERSTARRPGLSLWGGGVHPYGISHKKFGMWLFIISDSLTFSALLFGYAYLRNASPNWPAPFHIWPSIAVSTLMTFCLLSSSLTMVLAVYHSQHGRRAQAVRWLVATMAGGVAFLALHLNEWRLLIGEGMTPGGNPWGDAMFGGTFFTITGLHMTHVLSGVIYLGVIAWRMAHDRTDAEGVEVSGLYWHFVDLVWMFVFPLVYLMSVARGGH
jgi:cytochrome c oxidase subunit 3